MKPLVNSKHTFFVLIGLFLLICATFARVEAQTSLELATENQFSPMSATLVQNGFAVVTSTGGDGGGATIKVVNIRQFGALWTASQFAPTDSSGSMPLVTTWTRSSFQNQSIRGLALSGDGTVIYASTHFHQPFTSDRTPRIFKIGPTFSTPAVPTVLATLPGSLGVGTIDLDETHQLVFASNIDDGKIYSIDASTGAFTSFDPLAADASASGVLPPLGERVIAVAYHRLENRVYYGVWGGSSIANTIRSIGLNSSGAFLPLTDRLEATLLNNNAPAGDIEFNLAGNRMLVAEDPLADNVTIGLGAHFGRGLEYTGATNSWTLDTSFYQSTGRKYNVGSSGGTNSRGGTAWAYASMTNTTIMGNEQYVLFTSDILIPPTSSGPNIYGLQFTPATGGSVGGGSTSNSVVADLDYDTGFQDKSIYGDVDIRKSLTPTAGEVSIGGRVADASGNGVGVINMSLTQQDGSTVYITTNPFGYYRFDNIPVGQIVVVTPSSKQFSFNPSSQAVAVDEDVEDLNFTAVN